MIIWSDLFLSVVFVGVCVAGAPVLAVVGMPNSARPVLAIGTLVFAVLLGGFGGVAALMMMARLRRGDVHVPARQRYPLPAGMRPVEVATRSLPADVADNVSIRRGRDPGSRAHARSARPHR